MQGFGQYRATRRYSLNPRRKAWAAANLVTKTWRLRVNCIRPLVCLTFSLVNRANAVNRGWSGPGPDAMRRAKRRYQKTRAHTDSVRPAV